MAFSVRKAAEIAAIAVATVSLAAEPAERITCSSNIVSATMVATVCAHWNGAVQWMDALILWRGFGIGVAHCRNANTSCEWRAILRRSHSPCLSLLS